RYIPDFAGDVSGDDTSPDLSHDTSQDTSETNLWEATAAELFWRRTIFSSPTNGVYSSSNPGAARSSFYEKLLQCETREEAFAHQKTIAFLGSAVTVHGQLVTPLARVEQRINELERTDGAVAQEITAWKKSLDSITAWNWRNIAGSNRRSFHAYGVAIDLLMKPERGKETYWLWTREKGIDWRTVPEEDKLNPPRSVIRAFEEEGFIWGGKWPWYDTMHFEFHPELILLSLLPASPL
ncbi:MAG: M15 family metallopeptidase, partial [Treponema sp.]|nr:M15 family metallopeptidase [Treponema sp.]